jgi:SAM-dependent methyltransferase
MPRIPDLSDPRYLDEVGWFLYHEHYRREQYGDSYDAERLANSRLLLSDVLRALSRGAHWVEGKTVVSIGAGCTGDLAAFPAAVKIAIDPLLYTYQQLGMLIPDAAGSPTVYLSMGAENLPLLDAAADLVICRNALDHVPHPATVLAEIQRILREDGAAFISVDLGGVPTPDEPTVFSPESLQRLLREHFEIISFANDHPPHSKRRYSSVRVLARKRPGSTTQLDKGAVLREYEVRVGTRAPV